MKLCVTATSASFDSPIYPHFGRCLYFVIVDTDSMKFEILKNKSTSASNGAGIQAAQLIIKKEIDILITGFVGSNVFSILHSKGIENLIFTAGSVAGAVQAYKDGILEKLEGPNSPENHFHRVQNRAYRRAIGLI
jgi:predicted Fe-Mo cluster-binding NifX family protein